MPPAHSHPPSPSPTPFTNPGTNAPTANVRRNLFSTHLSRRPASSQQSSQPTETFIPPLSPTRSPERSPAHSPTHSRTHISDAIIATHPNGRPLLPTLPRLPAHLRLSTTSDDEQHPYDLDDEAERNNSPSRYNHPPIGDTDDHEDRARIERGLVEIMYRQRQRANPGTSTSPRATRSGIDPVMEPEGKTREEEELLNLIIASLREKVAVLDSEAWMYGEGMEDTSAHV